MPATYRRTAASRRNRRGSGRRRVCAATHRHHQRLRKRISAENDGVWALAAAAGVPHGMPGINDVA
jgi:hypothetical protein